MWPLLRRGSVSAGGGRWAGTLTGEAALVAGLLAPPGAAPQHGLGLHGVHLPVARVVDSSRKQGRQGAFTAQRPALTAFYPQHWLSLHPLPHRFSDRPHFTAEQVEARGGWKARILRPAWGYTPSWNQQPSVTPCLLPLPPRQSRLRAGRHACTWPYHRDSLGGPGAVRRDVPSQGQEWLLEWAQWPEVPSAGQAVPCVLSV